MSRPDVKMMPTSITDAKKQLKRPGVHQFLLVVRCLCPHSAACDPEPGKIQSAVFNLIGMCRSFTQVCIKMTQSGRRSVQVINPLIVNRRSHTQIQKILMVEKS